MIENQNLSFSEANKVEIEGLKDEITREFSDAQPPERNYLTSCECEECLGVRKDFDGIEWREASSELLEKNYDKLSLFSPQAFNYYLPAFLIYTLSNFDDFSSEVCEFTMYALTPHKSWKNKDGTVANWYKQEFAPFTNSQIELVYRFLNLAKENPIYIHHKTSIERSFDRLKIIRAAS